MGKLITLEAGNSTIKLAAFDSLGNVLHTQNVDHSGLTELIEVNVSAGMTVACASTANPEMEARMHAILTSRDAHVHWFRSGGSWPIPIRYTTPDTLGADRVLHAIAASWNVAGRPCIIVCCGTALVADLVNEKGEFVGGSISPGLNMRFQALHRNTGRLPYVQEWDDDAVSEFGTDTIGSIVTGVVLGMADEINHRIERYKRAVSAEAMVFLTGGAAPRLANHLRNINFADPHLIHRGLFRAVQLQTST